MSRTRRSESLRTLHRLRTIFVFCTTVIGLWLPECCCSNNKTSIMTQTSCMRGPDARIHCASSGSPAPGGVQVYAALQWADRHSGREVVGLTVSSKGITMSSAITVVETEACRVTPTFRRSWRCQIRGSSPHGSTPAGLRLSCKPQARSETGRSDLEVNRPDMYNFLKAPE